MIRHVDIKDFIPEIVDEHPDWETFVKLGNLTKLRNAPDGTFHHANYESGLLLYALVKKYRPQNILEIGTGRGYGAFCMAMAMRDCGIEGKIITLDVKHYDEKQTWAIDDGDGGRIEKLSLKDVWEEKLDKDLRSYIHHRQGFSSDSFPNLLQSRDFSPDFIYIDGDHSYTITRYDLFASILLANRPFRILMDDYMPNSNRYGVRKVIEQYLEKPFDLVAIHNNGRWHGGPHAEEPISASPSAQVLVDSEAVTTTLDKALPQSTLQQVVDGHHRWGRLSFYIEIAIFYNLRKRLGIIKPAGG